MPATSLRALLLLSLVLARPSGTAGAQAKVAYRLTDEPADAGEAGTWRVEVEVAGLDPAGGAVGLASDGWGWPNDLPYLELVESSPEAEERAADGSSLTLARPADWNGSAHIVYRLRLTRRDSAEHDQHGLLPSRGSGNAYGSSTNVLLRPTQAGDPIDAFVSIEVVAAQPEGTIVTGWGGLSVGSQRVVPDIPWGNAPVVFGAPLARSSLRVKDLEIEVFQFFGADMTARVAELVGIYAPRIQEAVGWPARSPSRVFLSDAMSGGMGSEYGLHMNVPTGADLALLHEDWVESILAHELFHEWLGIRLHESNGSLVWFREGFTEYFSQWFIAATGVLPREHFARTLEEYERYARSNSSLGRVAFADPSVEWRDGDGPNEMLAYRGAPLLALALDVELRRMGRPGLLQLVRDLLAEKHVFDPEVLHTWFVANGMEERWNASIAGLDVPPVTASLTAAGFVAEDVAIDVAYLGLRTVEEGPSWRVLEVDPEGPCARTEMRVGDVIDGFYPFTGAPTRLGEVPSRFTFGLAIFRPGLPDSFLGIRRGEESIRVPVEPELRPWGLRRDWRTTERTDAFFAFEPH